MLRGAARSRTVSVTKGLNGLSKIPEQVPAINDLDGVWSALTNTVGISTSSIGGDDLDAGPITQPGGHGGSFAVWQEINHFVGLQVHQHRTVTPSASPCPIIDTEDSRHWHHLSGTAGRRKTQQGIGTCRCRDAGGQTRSSFAAKSEAEVVLKIV